MRYSDEVTDAERQELAALTAKSKALLGLMQLAQIGIKLLVTYLKENNFARADLQRTAQLAAKIVVHDTIEGQNLPGPDKLIRQAIDWFVERTVNIQFTKHIPEV